MCERFSYEVAGRHVVSTRASSDALIAIAKLCPSLRRETADCCVAATWTALGLILTSVKCARALGLLVVQPNASLICPLFLCSILYHFFYSFFLYNLFYNRNCFYFRLCYWSFHRNFYRNLFH